MKKTISLLLALVQCLSLCACGGGNEAPVATGGDAPVAGPVEGPGNNESTEVKEIPSVASASVLKEGSCGTSTTFKLYDNGVLVVSGSDAITEPFEKFNDYIKYIKVEEGITYIGNKVFAGLKSCTMAELPSTLKTIDVAAFANSSNLETVNLPDELESIGTNAFYFAGLTSIEIPSSVVSMGSGAFSYCDLEELIIRNGIPELPSGAFEGNDELEFVVVPGSVKYIGEDAFRGCESLETVILCEGVEYIGASAFENIKTFAIPDSFQSVASSDMGEPNPTNSSSTVYCNDGSQAANRFSSVADIIVGYDGFIKNYNLDDYT